MLPDGYIRSKTLYSIADIEKEVATLAFGHLPPCRVKPWRHIINQRCEKTPQVLIYAALDIRRTLHP